MFVTTNLITATIEIRQYFLISYPGTLSSVVYRCR